MTASQPSPTDDKLLARYCAGDPKAFAELLDRYETPIYNFILRSVRDREAARDLTQEVFVRVIQRAADFRGESKVSTWLYTIGRNLVIDHGRRMQFRRHRSADARSDLGPSILEQTPANDETAESRMAATEIGRRISDAVENLPPDQREVFLLRQVQGLAFQEIAEITDAPENTVKSRMRYALERLQEALHEFADDMREAVT